jgi:hypothetical protein
MIQHTGGKRHAPRVAAGAKFGLDVLPNDDNVGVLPAVPQLPEFPQFTQNDLRNNMIQHNVVSIVLRVWPEWQGVSVNPKSNLLQKSNLLLPGQRNRQSGLHRRAQLIMTC